MPNASSMYCPVAAPPSVRQAADTIALSVRLFAEYEQIVDFRMPGVAVLGMDECPPHGHGWGPSPAHLLAAALGACLGGSLVACLRERHISLTDLSTEVRAVLRRDDGGTARIDRVDIQLKPVVGAGDLPTLASITPELLLEHSVIAQHVRPTIHIRLSIHPHRRASLTANQAGYGVHEDNRSEGFVHMATPIG